jgi:hypothetical protein
MQALANRSAGSPPQRAGQARGSAVPQRAAPRGGSRAGPAAAGVSDVFVLDFDGARQPSRCLLGTAGLADQNCSL